MKTRKLCANISTLLKKRLLLIITGVVLCCSVVWGQTTYTWTGAGGDSNWNTTTNWTPNGTPGASDTVVIDTRTSSITISFSSDITIKGLVTFGTNPCELTSSGNKLSAGVVFVGTSNDYYRTQAGLPSILATTIPNIDSMGSLTIAGNTLISIGILDTSSYTANTSQKNIVNITSGSSLIVTDTWETGVNIQLGNRDRTSITNNGSIIVTGIVQGTDESIDGTLESDPNAVVTETPTDSTKTYIWTGNTDNKWEEPSNWLPSTQYPNANDEEAIILNKTKQPIIAASAIDVKTLTIQSGASLTVNNTLTINGDYTLQSSINTNSSSTLKSTGALSITSAYSSSTLSLECDKLNADATLECNNLKVTTSASATAASSVSVHGDLDISAFSDWPDTVSINFIGSGAQVFTNSAQKYKSIIINGSGANVSSASPLETETLTITNGTYTASESVTVDDFTNSGTISGTKDFNIKNNLSDSGTWSGTGKIIFNGTTNQTFTPKSGTIYPEIEENKTAGTLTVASALSANTITLTKGTETTFSGTVTSTTFSDTAAAGKINFNAGGTISSATTFNTTGDVTFSGATVLDFGTNTVTHTAGKTILKGKIKTSKLTIGNASLDDASEIDGALDFAGGTDAAHRNSMARTAGTLKVSGNIEVVPSAFYTLGTTAITIIPITAVNTITFKNSGDLTIPHSTKITADFTNSGTLSAGGSATDSDCSINGSFTNNGSMTIPAGKYFSVTGTVDDSAGTSWNGTGTLQFTGTANQSFNNKTDRTYYSVNAKLTAGNKLTVSDPLTITKFNLTSGNVDFSGSVTIGTYSETGTPTSDLIFSGGGTINSATTMRTTGTVTIPASQTLAISNGAATPAYYNFTHSAGTTAIAGELKASAITLGATTISGTAATISGTAITTGTITTATNNTDKIELTASAGTFTLDTIGTSTNTLNSVTLDAGTSNLTLNGNSVYATNFILKTAGNISLTKIDLHGDLNLNTTQKLTLNGDNTKFSANSITFNLAPSEITLAGKIEVTGASGFVIPVTHPDVVLSANTTITTSTGPITLYDNITGTKDLTITNTGLFTLLDSVAPTIDPADASTAPTSSASIATFTQNGTGSCNLSGDISATGNISFTTPISLASNVKLSSTGGTYTAQSTVDSATANTNSLFVNASGNISFSNKIGSTAALASININSTSNVNLSTDITTGTDGIAITASTVSITGTAATIQTPADKKLEITGLLNNSNANLVINALTEITGSLTNTGKITANKNISLTGNFTDTTGTWISSSELKLNGSSKQSFYANPSTSYADINLASTNEIVFESSTSIISLTDGGSSTKIVFTKGTTLSITNPVTFNSPVQWGQTSESAIINLNIGTAATPTTVIFTNNVSCNNYLVITASSTTFQSSITKSASEYIKILGDLTTANAISLAPDFMLDGNFTSDGYTTFENGVYIFSNSPSPSPISLQAIKEIKGDLVFDSPRNINLTGSIKANNIVLYRGKLLAAANTKLHADNDIVLLGNEYKNTNPIIENEKLTTLTYSRIDFSAAALMPDGTALTNINNFTGAYVSAENSILQAGENFYSNGIDFTSSDSKEWFIDLPDIRKVANGFAEAHNCKVEWSHVRCFNPNSDDGSVARIPAYNCTDNSNNKWWLFDDFEIQAAYTVRDNAVCVEFNHPVRHNNNAIVIADIKNSSGAYEGVYKDPDCQTKYTIDEDVNAKDIPSSNYYLYLKANTSWKTDATGDSSGNSKSTDRTGNSNISVIPYVDYNSIHNYNVLVNVWGKRLSANADGDGIPDSKRTKVEDHTGPVLYSVRTGQELHTEYDSSIGLDSQPSYDSHNFIEFRYSEPVNFGDQTLAAPTAVFNNSNTSQNIWLPATASTVTNNVADINNVRVHDSLGAITNPVTQSGNITISGLGTLAQGQIYTGSNGTPDKYVNALYRMDEYSIRLSIAGYTEGTVQDRNGNLYKKWPGYIESAVLPGGSVQMVTGINQMVTDCALALDGVTPLYNPQEQYSSGQTVPNIINNSSQESPYGIWDISSPIFAPLRIDPKEEWGKINFYEAIGNNNGTGSTLDKIEFHLFDNTPTYSSSDEAIWLSEKGWVFNNSDNSTTLYDSNYTYSADIIGGSRQFNSDPSSRTSGGIRFATLNNAATAFKYVDSQVNSAVPSKDFVSGTSGIYIGAKAALFTGSAAIRHAPNNADGLYFGLGLTETDLPVSRSFTISYDETKGFITDLAGNRLRSAKIKSIDRTPPSFDIVLSPINQKEIYLVFVKRLSTDAATIKYRDNSGAPISLSDNFESFIPKIFDIISIDNNGTGLPSTTHHIDYSIPAKIDHIVSEVNEQEFTSIKLTLKENVTLDALRKLYIRIIPPAGYPEYTQDPVTSISNSRVTLIQDNVGNYLQMYSAHALSDFAISTINPLYAYDTDMTYNGETIMNGLYEEGSWAVHDWNADQQNYGTLIANHPYQIVADIDTGTEKADDLPGGIRIYLSASPKEESVSKQYNDDLNTSLRIWLPEVEMGLFPSLALENNPKENYVQIDSTLLDEKVSNSRIKFEIPKEISSTWGADKQISFIFGLTNKDGSLTRFYPSPYYDVSTGRYDLAKSDALPVYALRLLNPTDITSIDLWSFKTHALTEQRGGVTILNNVINATNGEKTVIKVNMPSTGKLNVMVMTLDGNIITYLNHGLTEAGEHYYSWNGKNNKNGTVARGMYFIRVVGNGFDETRKVMVVK